MVIRIPYGGGIGAAEHHSESSEAMYAHTPGIKVVAPATPAAAKGLLLAAIADPDPVVFLEPIRSYRATKEEVPEGTYTIPIGVAAVVRAGTDVTLVAYGAMLRDAIRAASLLESDGVSVEVIDLRTLSPLDSATIVTRREDRAGGIIGEKHCTAASPPRWRPWCRSPPCSLLARRRVTGDTVVARSAPSVITSRVWTASRRPGAPWRIDTEFHLLISARPHRGHDRPWRSRWGSVGLDEPMVEIAPTRRW
jgi:hypothetical protein